MKRIVSVLLAMLLLFVSACSSDGAKTALPGENAYRAVIGYEEGFVAVGDAGRAAYIDFEGQITPIPSGTEAQLRCITRWQDCVIAAGEEGTLLKIAPDFSVTSQQLQAADIVGIAVYEHALYAIDSKGMLYTSADAETWTASDSGLDEVVGMAAGQDCLIAASSDSVLMIQNNEGTQIMDYNEVYDGLAASIYVGHVVSDGIRIWLLGTGENGEAMAMHTDRGEIWFSASLEVYDTSGEKVQPEGLPVAIAYDDWKGERAMLYDSGGMLVMTDCQACNEYHPTQSALVTDGAFWEGYTCLAGAEEYLYVTTF